MFPLYNGKKRTAFLSHKAEVVRALRVRSNDAGIHRSHNRQRTRHLWWALEDELAAIKTPSDGNKKVESGGLISTRRLKMLPPPLKSSSVLWQSPFRPQQAADRQVLLLPVTVYFKSHSCNCPSWRLHERLSTCRVPCRTDPTPRGSLSYFQLEHSGHIFTPGSVNVYSRWNAGPATSGQAAVVICKGHKLQEL